MEPVDCSYTAMPSTESALHDLAARIVSGAGAIAAASCRWLLLVAEFDAADGCVQFGLASTAQWLSYSCGLAHRTAVDHVRVARSLATHAVLATEMAAGRLSYSHVRAISRVVREGERQLVDDLVESARHGTVAQLESLVRGLRTVDDVEGGGDAVEREYASETWTNESRWRLTARLDPERGAAVSAALRSVGQAEGLSAADALVRLAEIGLAALADAAKPPRALRGDETAAVVVHLDAARLPAPAAPAEAAEPRSRSAERDRPYARVAGGPGLPDRVVQRLLCSGRIRTVVRDGHNVLDVGRSHRLVTDRQYRALMIRHHGHCAHPGCPNTRDLHAHHLVHWLHGGRTDLANLILLCERHHVAYHDGAFTITALGKSRFRFVYTGGRVLPEDAIVAISDHAEEPLGQVEIAPDAATPHWDGQRLDRRYAVAVLAARRAMA